MRPDAPPTLAVATPSDLKETSPDDLLTVAIVAHDDVAVASAELHYTIERANGSTGPSLGHVTAPLQGLGTPSARGEAAMQPQDAVDAPGRRHLLSGARGRQSTGTSWSECRLVGNIWTQNHRTL